MHCKLCSQYFWTYYGCHNGSPVLRLNNRDLNLITSLNICLALARSQHMALTSCNSTLASICSSYAKGENHSCINHFLNKWPLNKHPFLISPKAEEMIGHAISKVMVLELGILIILFVYFAVFFYLRNQVRAGIIIYRIFHTLPFYFIIIFLNNYCSHNIRPFSKRVTHLNHLRMKQMRIYIYSKNRLSRSTFHNWMIYFLYQLHNTLPKKCC